MFFKNASFLFALLQTTICKTPQSNKSSTVIDMPITFLLIKQNRTFLLTTSFCQQSQTPRLFPWKDRCTINFSCGRAYRTHNYRQRNRSQSKMMVVRGLYRWLAPHVCQASWNEIQISRVLMQIEPEGRIDAAIFMRKPTVTPKCFQKDYMTYRTRTRLVICRLIIWIQSKARNNRTTRKHSSTLRSALVLTSEY